MMFTYPTLSKEVFLWRLQLLWTLVLTLTCAWFIICSNTVVSSKSQLRRCGRLAVWALSTEILDKSYSDKVAEKRKLSRQSYFAFLSHLGLSHDDLVCVKCKCKARQTERFQLRIFELSIPI